LATPNIPSGLRDILPRETSEIRYIEERIAQVFRSFGYGEVIVPTFEYYSTLSVETGELLSKEMFKFFDQDGSMVALRPEMTTSVARLAVQRMTDQPLPLRLFYRGNAFRHELPQGGQAREFRQAGIELIGNPGPDADAEMIVVMIESLRAVGLSSFQVSVGQSEFLQGIIESIEDKQTRLLVRSALLSRDLVRLNTILSESGVTEAAALDQLSSLRGGDCIARASQLVKNKKSLAAVENLSAIIDRVATMGYSSVVTPDLGIIRNLDYYTGAVFEGYSEGIGFPISGGGRYDRLTSEFGWSQPATGFQHGVERLHYALALENRKMQTGLPPLISVIDETNDKSVVDFCSELRQNGYRVALDAVIEGSNTSIPTIADISIQVTHTSVTIIDSNGNRDAVSDLSLVMAELGKRLPVVAGSGQ